MMQLYPIGGIGLSYNSRTHLTHSGSSAFICYRQAYTVHIGMYANSHRCNQCKYSKSIMRGCYDYDIMM